MYAWRKLTPEEKVEALQSRQASHRPWHSPPHQFPPGTRRFFITAACYQHAPFIAHARDRLSAFESSLLSACDTHAQHIFAWCILPNHYHILIQTSHIEFLVKLSASSTAAPATHGTARTHAAAAKCGSTP